MLNLYIPVEVKVRELHGRFFVGLVGAQRGWRSVIGREDELHFLLKRRLLPPGVLFANSIQPQRLWKLEDLRQGGSIVVSQDEEHGILGESYAHFAKHRFSGETLGLIERQFCWGNFDHDGCSSAYETAVEKLCVTGSPRVDMWRPEMAPFYAQSVERIREEHGRYILLLSSHLGRVFSPRGAKGRLQQMKKIGLVSDAQEEETYWEKVAYQEKLIEHFRGALEACAQAFDDLTIIVRPHPGEDPQGWARVLRGHHHRIRVIRKGSASAWIRGATAVIHNSSSGALESAIAGTPVIAYRPLRSRFDRDIPNMVSRQCSTIDELISAIDESQRTAPQHRTSNLPDFVTDRLANLDGDFAATRIIDAIAQLDLERIQPGRTMSWCRQALALRWPIQKAYWFVRRRSQHPADRKFRTLQADEVGSILDRFQHTFPSLGGITYRHLGRTIYALEQRAS